MSDSEQTIISHLEDLRKMLLRILFATGILYPFCYWLSPVVIRFLVAWSFPDGCGALYYFSPMEMFLIQLKLALILALIVAYPWNILQIWNFLKPALYPGEQRAFICWIAGSTILFLGGAFFCAKLILPLIMEFSRDFSSLEIQPMLGIGNFLGLAGWLMLAFGTMFQTPVLVLLAVRFGLVSYESLRNKRPYIMTAILILAALLTPPDIISQLLLAVPAWLLFELGLLLSKNMELKNNEST